MDIRCRTKAPISIVESEFRSNRSYEERPAVITNGQAADRHRSASMQIRHYATYSFNQNFRFYNPISPSLRFIINTVAKRTSRLDEQAGPSTRGRRERCRVMTMVTRKVLCPRFRRRRKAFQDAPLLKAGAAVTGAAIGVRRYQRISDDLGAGDQGHRTAPCRRVLFGGEGDRRPGRQGSRLQGHDAEPRHVGRDQSLHHPARTSSISRISRAGRPSSPPSAA